MPLQSAGRLLVSLSLTPRDVASGCILSDARPKALSLLVLRKLKVSSAVDTRGDYAGSSSYSPQKLTTLGVVPSSKPYCPKLCKRSSKVAMGGRSTIPAKAVGPKAEQSSQEEIETPKISPPEQKGEVSADSHQRDAALPEKSAEEGAHTSSDTKTANLSTEEESLAEELNKLKIRPDESDQVGTSVADNDLSDDNEGDYAQILQRMRQVFSAEKRKPKEVLQPLLDTFDLDGIADYIQKGKAKKIIVMCGAGISVSAGIPDFRTPGTGLYDNLMKFNLPHPQAVFELDYFRHEPKAFYQLAKELFPGKYKPTPAHYFMTLLHKKGLLLRCFTQNIDSLEREAKLPAEKIIAAHGNFDTAHCITCHAAVPQDTVREAVEAGKVCTCPRCMGYVKPDIVFFGENLPAKFFTRAKADFPKADLLIVMGTSLVVNPFASLIDHVGKKIPRVLINRERVGEADATLLLLGHRKGFSFDEKHRDALFLGDCDDGVRQLAKKLGWEAELDELIQADEKPPKKEASL